jgi:hypothetical protein
VVALGAANQTDLNHPANPTDKPDKFLFFDFYPQPTAFDLSFFKLHKCLWELGL